MNSRAATVSAPPSIPFERRRFTVVPTLPDRVSCTDCGHWFPALDGPALLYGLKGSCPDCGGEFELKLGSRR
jgi:hypothetical protein